jgi:nitroimidazol reductase NimA-like FMN-containing flavoprotein (pyridoxamine 5'-phosphate oxidase superfamily)
MTLHEPTDRRGLRVLSYDECLLLLRRATVARLGFVHHGEPEILPVTFGMDGSAPVFRTTWGSKLDAAAGGGLVCLEADSMDPALGRAWSVVVKGTASVEYADVDIARFESIGVPTWVRDDSETFWVRVRPESVTGRELTMP